MFGTTFRVLCIYLYRGCVLHRRQPKCLDSEHHGTEAHNRTHLAIIFRITTNINAWITQMKVAAKITVINISNVFLIWAGILLRFQSLFQIWISGEKSGLVERISGLRC